MPDLVTFGETMLRLSPPRGKRLETTQTFDVQAGGAESNVAAAASVLGRDTVWLSKLPDSPLGRRVVRELRGYGVRTGVVWAEDARLGTYYLEHGGEPRGTNVVYDRENSAITDVAADELPAGVLDDADYFHTTGITPALSEAVAATTEELLRRASDAGVRTSFDLNYRSKLWSPREARIGCESLFPHVDLLIAAERDAKEVLSVDGPARDIAYQLSRRYDLGSVVITRGEKGAVGLHGSDVHGQSAFETETFDAIGTGDAFVAGFLAKQIEGGDMPDALEYGAATAALKRTLDGDIAVVGPDEVEAVIAGDADTISR